MYLLQMSLINDLIVIVIVVVLVVVLVVVPFILMVTCILGLSKRQSLSPTVLFRTTLTRSIVLDTVTVTVTVTGTGTGILVVSVIFNCMHLISDSDGEV